ncbi:MAG TPA: hypothetical protein VMR31_04060 [Myxococcota bacterium]|nr:hypothetical protein [Myxococcota bacterium]
MWKVVLFLLAIFILGPLAVRYVLKNPLGPVVAGNEVVVESQSYEVHFARSGPLSGTYLVAGAESEDWSDQPVNAQLLVVPLQAASDYLRAYPDFHLYGSQSNTQIAALASGLSVVAASRTSYSALRALVDQHQSRNAGHGERLCVTVSGESLALTSVRGVEDDADHMASVQRVAGSTIVFADSLAVSDCAKLLAADRR